MKNLRGKRVLVTGGARGMGYAIADHFAAEGAEVILTDVDEKALEEAKERLSRTGARAHAYPLDVTSIQQIAAVHETVRGEVGTIDVLVNNAGIVAGGPFLEVPVEKHLAVIRVNTEGMLAMTHEFLPDLIDGPEGHIVNLASISGFAALPYAASYASSTWGAVGFSESIKLELKKTGIKHVGVTTVCPGYVTTGMFEGVKAPLFAPFLTAEKVAREVLAAVKENKGMVFEPLLFKLAPFLPLHLSRIVGEVIRGTETMQTWRGHGS
jgi:all-trans-retinol dehydrogenase (NAD+)